MKHFFLSVFLILAGCNHLVQRGLTNDALVPHPDPQATTAQAGSLDLVFNTHLINALIALPADPYAAKLAAASAICIATNAHLSKDKLYLARLVACLAAILFAEDYVLLRVMRNTARADAYAVDVVADPEFVAHDASNDVLDAASADDIDDDDPVVAAAHAAAVAYATAKLAVHATDAPDLLLAPVVAAAAAVAYATAKLAVHATDAPDLLLAPVVAAVAAAAYDRVKAAIYVDKANLARIKAAATYANVVAASANVLDAHDKIAAEAVAKLAKAVHDSAKSDVESTSDLANVCLKNAYNSNAATMYVLCDAFSHILSDMDQLTLPLRIAKTALAVHRIRAFPSSSILSE